MVQADCVIWNIEIEQNKRKYLMQKENDSFLFYFFYPVILKKRSYDKEEWYDLPLTYNNINKRKQDYVNKIIIVNYIFAFFNKIFILKIKEYFSFFFVNLKENISDGIINSEPN